MHSSQSCATDASMAARTSPRVGAPLSSLHNPLPPGTHVAPPTPSPVYVTPTNVFPPCSTLHSVALTVERGAYFWRATESSTARCACLSPQNFAHGPGLVGRAAACAVCGGGCAGEWLEGVRRRVLGHRQQLTPAGCPSAASAATTPDRPPAPPFLHRSRLARPISPPSWAPAAEPAAQRQRAGTRSDRRL